MTNEIFQRILDATHRFAWRMTFYMEGEPMAHPKLFNMIAKATKKRLFTSISTNFTMMREQLLKPLFDSKLDYISVCLDGFTQEAYRKYRINGDVTKVKAGLRMIMDYKRAGKFKRPFVNVYSIKFGHVVPQIPQIKKFCEEIAVDQLTFRPDESNFDGATPALSMPKPRPTRKCYWPWIAIQVDVDGSVFPCPIAFQHGDRQAYGNLIDNPLANVWNGEKYVATREYLSGRISRDDPRASGLPCLKCRWFGENPNPEPPPWPCLVQKAKGQKDEVHVNLIS